MNSEGKIYLACCGVVAVLAIAVTGTVAVSTSSTTNADNGQLGYLNSRYTCNASELMKDAQEMLSDGGFSKVLNARLLEVTKVVETARTQDKLVCKFAAKSNVGLYNGTLVLKYYIENGKGWMHMEVADGDESSSRDDKGRKLAECFSLANFKWGQREYGKSYSYINVGFEVTNNCSVDASPTVEVVLRDANGGLIKVSQENPSLFKNIKSGQLQPFTGRVYTDSADAVVAKVEYSIKDVRTY